MELTLVDGNGVTVRRGTIAAVAFAAVLYKVVRSGAVQDALTAVIQNALNISL